jgi:hypothetical protein
LRVKEDFRNKIPDFRLQTIGCDGVIVWRLTSYCSRFPKEDVRNKMPDFRIQTIDCEAIIVWHLTSCFSRLPKATINRVVVHRLCRGQRDDLRSGFADRERSMGSGGIGESRDIAAERVKFLSESVKKPETCRIFVSGKFRFYDDFGKKN